MLKKILYLLGILVTILVGMFSFWYHCCDCGVKSGKTDTTPANTAIVALPPDKTTALSSAEIDSAALKDRNEIKEKLNSQPLILYFETNQSFVNLNQEAKQKLDEIRDYFKKYPDAEIFIAGHTDNIGDHNANVKLGQDRADFVKNFLVKDGVIEKKITSVSKGPDDPIAVNKTSEGRAKNRRAVLLIK